jgi:hypothetical protein
MRCRWNAASCCPAGHESGRISALSEARNSAGEAGRTAGCAHQPALVLRPRDRPLPLLSPACRPGSTTEDARWVVVDLVDQRAHIRAGLDAVVAMEARVAVAPVERPRLGGLGVAAVRSRLRLGRLLRVSRVRDRLCRHQRGQLLTGARDRGGEIAHTPLCRVARRARAGRHGCLRTVRVLAARQEAAGLFRGRTRKRSMYSSVKTRCSRISSRAPSLSRSATLRRMRSW